MGTRELTSAVPGGVIKYMVILCLIIATVGLADADDPSPVTLLEEARALADNPEQALALAEQAQQAAETTGASAIEGQAELVIARAQRKMKQYELADEACRESLTAAQKAHDRDTAFAACDLASKMHYRLGRYDRAQEWEERALSTAKMFGDQSQEAQSFNDLGVLLKKQGRIPEARENYQRALEIRRLLGDRRGEAQSLMNLGIIYKNLGDYPRALEYQLESMTIRNESGDEAALAQSYQNIGNLWGHLGDFEKAADYYRRSLRIHREAGVARGIADSLSNLSEAYSSMGRADEALAAVEEALELAREADDIPSVAGCLRRIGELYADKGEFDRAEASLNEAVALARQTNTRRTEASALLILGRTLQAMGNSAAAAEALGQAVTVAEEIDDLPTLRNSTAEFATVLADLGRHAEAYEILARSKDIDKTMDENETSAEINNLQARYTLQAQESQIALLQRDNQIQTLSIARQRWIGGFTIALLALGLAIAAAGWSRSRAVRRSHRLLEEKNGEILRQQETLESVNNALEAAARQLNAANEALFISSITDGLTGVFNRRHILESLDKELHRGRRHDHDLAVLMIDLDHFKQVNDRFGHAAGDKVLERTAAIMQGELRGEDLIGRYGGEEFLVVLPATDREGAVEVGERIRRAVEGAGFGSSLEGVKITISVGVADITSCNPQTAENLLRLADAALYRAKDEGRNRTVRAR